MDMLGTGHQYVTQITCFLSCLVFHVRMSYRPYPVQSCTVCLATTYTQTLRIMVTIIFSLLLCQLNTAWPANIRLFDLLKFHIILRCLNIEYSHNSIFIA